jgi:hypothetical protein
MSIRCECEQYGDIELLWSAVDDRIKKSQTLRNALKPLAESPDKRNGLYEWGIPDRFSS